MVTIGVWGPEGQSLLRLHRLVEDRTLSSALLLAPNQLKLKQHNLQAWMT